MLAKKLLFSHDVLDVVREMCKTVFNLQSNNDIVRMFGISNEQMEEVVNKIIDALPDSMFEQLYPQLLDEMKYICAREYIFFQVQEKWDDPRYQEDLMNFIHIFSRDIQKRMNAHGRFPHTMWEEK